MRDRGFLPKVWADESRLVQILFNLIHNVIKYTESGRIAVTADVVNGRACVHVLDTGMGMDEETVRRIFLPYEQETPALPQREAAGA